jgi:adenosylmethionine-8-amino-7-oxononanoate aminotransferase
MEDSKIFFTTGGGDAIDTAAKMARLYWQTIGQPNRVHIISRKHGYHGTMAFGTSIGGIEANRTGYGPLVPNTSSVPHDSAQALADEIERLGAGNVGAFFCEPVIGAGGVFPPPEGYIEECARICRETGVLFVIDAVIAGFGRLGSWFGCERFGIAPDMITFAKGVTSGYQPLGGVVVSGRVAEPFWSEPGRITFRHGQTYAGHATVCAAGLANIAIMEREGLVTKGQELERVLFDALAPLAEHPLVGEVRGGTGMMTAIAFSAELLERDPATPVKAYRAVRKHGVILRALGVGLAFSPPLIITPDEIGEMADAVRAGLDDLLDVTEVPQQQVAARS